MNAIKSLALKAALVWSTGALFTSCALGQPAAHAQLREFLPTPPAAAYDARARAVLLGAGAEVRRLQPGAGYRLIDGGGIAAAGGDTILRLRVDASGQRLWVLDVGTVRVIDLTTNRLLRTVALPNWMFATPGDNCLPDLKLDTDGAALVTDNVQPKLWRIDPRDFSVRERVIALPPQFALDVGFSALAVTEEGAVFAAMAAPGLLWRVDRSLTRAERVAITAPVHGACVLESQRTAGMRELALFVLAPGRGASRVWRVLVAAAGEHARLEPRPAATVDGPATLLRAEGALFLVARPSPTAADARRRQAPSEWMLRPMAAEHGALTREVRGW